MPPPARDQVFISYSHKDKEWLERLQTHLKPYLRDVSIISWSDKQIRPGSQWFTEIKTALTNTKVAVLLVTPDFIASDFIHEYELGPLLKEAKQGGVRILWVPVRASSYKKTVLKDYQAVVDPDKPLANMTAADRDPAWVKICAEIEKAVSADAGDKKAKKALAKLSQVKPITRRPGYVDNEVRRPVVQEIARGWKKDPDTLPWLKERAASDSEGDVRQAAVQEIARGWKEDPDTLPWLKERAVSDSEGDVRQAAVQESPAVGEKTPIPCRGSRSARSPIVRDVRQAAVQEIARGWKEDPDTLPWLKERAASDSEGDVRQAALQEIASFRVT
jgi:hypothetical protein